MIDDLEEPGPGIAGLELSDGKEKGFLNEILRIFFGETMLPGGSPNKRQEKLPMVFLQIFSGRQGVRDHPPGGERMAGPPRHESARVCFTGDLYLIYCREP